MYEVLMFRRRSPQDRELLDLIEDVGGFVLQRTQVQVMVTLTIAIPARTVRSSKKRRRAGGRSSRSPWRARR